MLMVRPENPPDQKQLARALVTYADIFLARHDPLQGLSRLDDALRILTPVLEENPKDRGTVSYVLAMRGGRATGLIALHRWSAATAELDAADATISALGDRDMRLGARQEEFLVLRGDIDLGRGDLEAAAAKYAASIASLQDFILHFPEDYEPKKDLASANIKLADLLRRRGAKDEARARDQAAVDLLQPYHDSGDLVPDDEALLASARRWL
jgi:tetratricopeptide (TPR) repeat protein